MATYKTLLQIYNERPDLQKAFPNKGKALDDWWNKHGVKEYPDVTLVQPGDKRLTPKADEPSATAPKLLDIYNARPDVQAEAKRLFPGQNPTEQGTEANRWLNDWYNRVGKAEGADMAAQGLIPTTGIDTVSTDYSKLEEKDGTIINTETGEAYSKPEDLATDLGIAPDEIDWGQITPATEELPTDQITVWKDGQSTIIQRSELDKYTELGYATTDVVPESLTGDPNQDKMLELMQEMLDKLIERGQTINPNVEITPEKAAEFMAQAEREIDPYYASQMQLSRESLLTSLGYTREDLSNFEDDMEKKYGKRLRVAGEEAAETGFTRAGRREVGERELAEATQAELGVARTGVSRAAGQAAREYAQLWGAGDIPTERIGAAPRVVAGQAGFQRGVGDAAIYTLSDDIYDDLIGTKQWEQKAEKSRRVSELEAGYRTGELEKRHRELTL